MAWNMCGVRISRGFEMVSIQSIRDGYPKSGPTELRFKFSSILRWNHCNIPILRKHHLEGLHEILFSINELVHSDPLDSLNLLSRKHCIAKVHVKSAFFVGIASGHCRVNNLNHQPDSVAQCKQDACADTQDGTIETDSFFLKWVNRDIDLGCFQDCMRDLTLPSSTPPLSGRTMNSPLTHRRFSWSTFDSTPWDILPTDTNRPIAPIGHIYRKPWPNLGTDTWKLIDLWTALWENLVKKSIHFLKEQFWEDLCGSFLTTSHSNWTFDLT